MTRLRLRRILAAGCLCLFGFQAAPIVAAQPDSADAYDSGEPTERVGWLRPNYAQPGVDAPFVLLDNAGRIRAFVRPAPNVRIGRFVNHRIRVRGEETALRNQPVGLLEVAEAGSPDAVLGQGAAPRRRLAPAGDLAAEAPFYAARPAAYEEIAPPMASELPAPDMAVPRSRLTTPYYAPQDGGPPQDGPPQDGAPQDYDPPANELLGEAPPGSVLDGPGDEHDHGGDWGPACASCGGCGHASCNTCCCNACGPPGRIWLRAEYLYWFTEGMHVPPLVSTGPSDANPGYLGSPGTQTLFGGDRVNGFGRSGARITLGAWLNCCQTIGIEGDYFGLATATTNFSESSYGSPILSRPFYDVGIRPGATTVVGQNVELAAEPGVIKGTVSAYTSTGLLGAGIRGRFNLCCSQNCSCDPCHPCLSGPGGCRVDFLLGYRFLQLRDAVSVQENLTTLNATPPIGFVINDSFTTRNQFNGVDLGFAMMKYKGRWSLEFTPRMALGNNYEVANVAGSTAISQGGTTSNYTGGLLAQSSNIGTYSRNQFAVVPELDLNLGYWITPRLRAIVGYTFLYWSGVARAGDQIDTNVNSTLLPAAAANGVTPSGDPRYPMFAWHTTDFWAQGINAGLDYRW